MSIRALLQPHFSQTQVSRCSNGFVFPTLLLGYCHRCSKCWTRAHPFWHVMLWLIVLITNENYQALLTFSLLQLVGERKFSLSLCRSSFLLVLVQVLSLRLFRFRLWVFVAHKVWLKLLSIMNLAIIGSFQHFHLTDGEDEVAVSFLRPDLGFGSMVCPFLIKVSPFVWRIGSDLKLVDWGIKTLRFMFRSCVHMKWLSFFCFIYVFVGLGEKLRLGFQGKSGCLWLFGVWIREYCGCVKVFVKHGVASRSGPTKEGKDDGAGVRSLVRLASRGTERARHSVVLSNRTCSNNMNRRQGSRSGVLSSPPLEPSALFRRALSCFPRILNVEVKASVLGLLLFPS